MNNNGITKFKNLLKVLDVIYLIALTLTGILNAILIGFTIFMSFVSQSELNHFFKNHNSEISIKLKGIKYVFSHDYIINNLMIDKNMFISLLLVSMINVLLLFLIILYARKLINNFRKNNIFSISNGKFIETIAILFLLFGHMYQFMSSLLSIFINNALNISNYLSEHDVVKQISYELFGIDANCVIIALTIWFLGKAFRYGSYLQDEFDSTV